MSSLVQPKLTRKEDIFNHDDARAICGNKSVESSERIVSRRTLKEMKPLNILLLDASSWQTVSTCQGIIDNYYGISNSIYVKPQWREDLT